LLERNSHGFSVGNLKCFHADTLRHPGLATQSYYTALLMTLCINQAVLATYINHRLVA
jgi:hypothetical protein